LYDAGLLDERERAALIAEWKDDFDTAQELGFMLCTGNGWLKGDEAKAAHYQWADIPETLVHKWAAERHRCARTISKLETAAPR
jgi:hypothetical protein